MKELKVYKQDGAEQGVFTLSGELFDLPWNGELVHQVVVAIEKNMRSPIAHTKDRSEVRGGGRKPWRQKKLGRARHGSIRSPLWVGGGVTFGPRKERKFSVAVNKKMRRKAFFTVLSQKIRDGKIAFIDSLVFEAPSTKAADVFVRGVCGDAVKKNRCLIVLPAKDMMVTKSFRNLPGVSVVAIDGLNARDVLIARKLFFVDPEETMRVLEGRYPSVRQNVAAT